MNDIPLDVSKIRLFQYEKDSEYSGVRLFQSKSDYRPNDYSKKNKAFEGDGILHSDLEYLRKRMNNSSDAYIVIQAVEHGDFRTLVKIICELVDLSLIAKENLNQAQEELKRTKREVEELKKDSEEKMAPPALKRELSTEKMIQYYKVYNSFSKVARFMGCDRKTVKNRLIRCGYIKEGEQGI